MLPVIIAHLTPREIATDALLLGCVLVTLRWPRVGDRAFGVLETWGASLAGHKRLMVFSIAVIAVLIRVILLGPFHKPFPRMQDEFSYLLAADTFAHGRLTNPPHPMWVFFDTVHVNQRPTYMSKFPPAQGAVLALGQLLGDPWIGVILSVGLMCGAIVWGLQGWLPPRWALVGGLLVLFRIGIFSYWMNSYWGGAIPAAGGALVIGALPRLFRRHRARDAVILAFGGAVLLNSRPVEGLVLCLPVLTMLFVWLCGTHSPSFRVTVPRVVVPFSVVMTFSIIFVGFYNWRATGNAFLFPYVLNQRTYFSTPAFVWQKAAAPLHYQNAQFDSMYNGWVRSYYFEQRVRDVVSAARHASMVGLKFVYFFLWPELCIPLAVLPWLLGDSRTRFLAVQSGLSVLGFFCVIWFLPHYAAPLTASLFALVTQVLRHMRHWEFRGRPVGIGLSRVIVLLAVVLAPFHQRDGTLAPSTNLAVSPFAYRAKWEGELSALPAKQLVIVRYSPHASAEWVYNRADIDEAKVIWAREIPDLNMKPLFDYFRDRQVWLVEPDISPPRLRPYPVNAHR